MRSFSERFQHSAWGTPHYNRVYEMALNLARVEDMEVDEEALFAAALIHDMGAFEPYKCEGVDHADRSADLCRKVLENTGFPEAKIPLVEEIIRYHMYYAEPGKSPEAIVFRDADILDFMGVIGITRILSITGSDSWAPDLNSAIDLIKQFNDELPAKLITNEAGKICEGRKFEMEEYLALLAAEAGISSDSRDGYLIESV